MRKVMRIVAENISFTYNQKTAFKSEALKNISLTIEEGSFFGIIGHTGSGKSTFIQLLNALLPVQSGKLTIGNYDLSSGKKTDKKLLKELRSKVGMVFQYPEYQLFAETVFDDVAFGYKNFHANASAEEIKSAVYSALEKVGIDAGLAQKSPFELSGGQKRRVAIAGVIVTAPEILILDEPVAGLDPRGKRELMQLLKSLRGSVCKTIIIVSHDMDEVAENCSAIAVFSGGECVLVGKPKDVFSNRQKLEDLRLGVPLTAYLESKLRESGIEISCDFTTAGFLNAIKGLIRR